MWFNARWVALPPDSVGDAVMSNIRIDYTVTSEQWSDFHPTVSRLEWLTAATRHEAVVTRWLRGEDVTVETEERMVTR